MPVTGPLSGNYLGGFGLGGRQTAGGVALPLNGFVQAQQKVLRRVLRSNATSALYTNLNMGRLTAYRDFDLLYQAFVRAAPVQSPQTWLDALTPLAGMGGGKRHPLNVLNVPNLVTKGKPDAAVLYRNVPLPVNDDMFADFMAMEKGIRGLMRQHNLLTGGSIYYLNEVEPHMQVNGQLPLHSWFLALEQQRGWFNKKGVLPLMSGMPNAGNSRFQWFSAHWDQLKMVGKSVDVLVVHPKTLIDFALYVSQQEGKFVPLAHWCPGLKGLVLTGYDMALQRVELGYLLAGLPDVKWVQWFMQPGGQPGVCAWQADLSMRQRLLLNGDGSTFYEFVPVEDILPDGRFVRNFHRLHAGMLQPGRSYMPVMSNTAGWLAISSGQALKVLPMAASTPGQSSAALSVMMEGPVVKLNGLAEEFSEQGVVEALSNINKALQGHGVFLRDGMLGHHVTERQPVWVLELSRPLGEIPPGLLDSIARRMHGELELRHEVYRNNLRLGNIKPPQVHFVPIGTFAAASPRQVDMSLFDHSPDAKHIHAIIEAAWQNSVVQLGH